MWGTLPPLCGVEVNMFHWVFGGLGVWFVMILFYMQHKNDILGRIYTLYFC